jgi:serine/threonine protein phosphatase PrpC
MHTFVYHENASGDKSFTKTGDAWNIDDKNMIFAVGDSPLRCLIRDTKEYPFDDYGYEAASTFCNSFIKYTKEYLKDPTFSTSTLKEILIKCNREIYKLNKELNKKYKDLVNYDLAETVGVGALIKDNKLYYGGVEDCYVHVLRGEALKNIATWDYQIKKASKYIDKLSSENKLKDYIPKELINKLKKENRWEPCWCNYLRNNKNALDEEGNLVGWGCFTGEKEAEEFIQTHSVKLKKNDYILLFSDGMIPVLRDKGFINWFVQNVTSSFYFQYQMRSKIMELLGDRGEANKEKTLIYMQY